MSISAMPSTSSAGRADRVGPVRLANVNGRAAIVLADGVADVATVSDGRFGPARVGVRRLGGVRRARRASVTAVTGALVESELGCPVPAPGRCSRSGSTTGRTPRSPGCRSSRPATFTKFPASLSGPFDDIEFEGPKIDWEVDSWR